VTLTEDDEVIERLASKVPDEALGVAVLERRQHARRPHRHRHLLRGPRGVRLPRHVDVENAAPLERQDEEDE
jgi:hypothetical protein